MVAEAMLLLFNIFYSHFSSFSASPPHAPLPSPRLAVLEDPDALGAEPGKNTQGQLLGLGASYAEVIALLEQLAAKGVVRQSPS